MSRVTVPRCTATLLGTVLLVATVGGGCGARPDEDDREVNETTASATSRSADPSSACTTAASLDPALLSNLSDAVAAGFPALVAPSAPEGWSLNVSTFETAFQDGTWNEEFSDPDGVPVTLYQAGLTPVAMAEKWFGAGARSSGSVELEAPWDPWALYEDGTRIGLVAQLAGTSIVVLAPDRATAEVLVDCLTPASDVAAGLGTPTDS